MQNRLPKTKNLERNSMTQQPNYPRSAGYPQQPPRCGYPSNMFQAPLPQITMPTQTPAISYSPCQQMSGSPPVGLVRSAPMQPTATSTYSPNELNNPQQIGDSQITVAKTRTLASRDPSNHRQELSRQVPLNTPKETFPTPFKRLPILMIVPVFLEANRTK